MNMPQDAQHMSGPIPGSSLTVAPGSVPWEKPPMFTQVDDAVQFIIKQFQNKENVHRFLATMEMGAPLDTTVWTLIQHGFMDGKWTPSLGMLLIKPITYLLTAMLKRAKIKYLISYSPQKGQLDDLFAGLQQKKEKQKVSDTQVKQFMSDAKSQTAAPPTMPTGGLMSPPQMQPTDDQGATP